MIGKRKTKMESGHEREVCSGIAWREGLCVRQLEQTLT